MSQGSNVGNREGHLEKFQGHLELCCCPQSSKQGLDPFDWMLSVTIGFSLYSCWWNPGAPIGWHPCQWRWEMTWWMMTGISELESDRWKVITKGETDSLARLWAPWGQVLLVSSLYSPKSSTSVILGINLQSGYWHKLESHYRWRGRKDDSIIGIIVR